MSTLLQVGSWLAARGAVLSARADRGEYVVTVNAAAEGDPTRVTTRAMTLDAAVRGAMFEYDTVLLKQRREKRGGT